MAVDARALCEQAAQDWRGGARIWPAEWLKASAKDLESRGGVESVEEEEGSSSILIAGQNSVATW